VLFFTANGLDLDDGWVTLVAGLAALTGFAVYLRSERRPRRWWPLVLILVAGLVAGGTGAYDWARIQGVINDADSESDPFNLSSAVSVGWGLVLVTVAGFSLFLSVVVMFLRRDEEPSATTQLADTAELERDAGTTAARELPPLIPPSRPAPAQDASERSEDAWSHALSRFGIVGDVGRAHLVGGKAEQSELAPRLGPDTAPSTLVDNAGHRRRLVGILLAGVAILAVGLAIGGYLLGEYRAGADEARAEGYRAGRQAGYSAGHDAGYDQGHSVGLKQGTARGRTIGKSIGYQQGYNAGLDKGMLEGRKSIFNSFTPAFVSDRTYLVTTATDEDGELYLSSRSSEALDCGECIYIGLDSSFQPC
jgi:hypothetical protein